ncbi:MAG: lysine--tRNA ligase, partial [Spirochaetales bacterium]|nr:lysine--tRNA ligase [Spirochaetales bacterium]
QRRIYELSQVRSVPARMPTQVPFRHLCNLLQIHGGDVEGVIAYLGLDPDQEGLERIRTRAACAWNWLREFAPESFRWELRAPGSPPIDAAPAEREALRRLRDEVVAHLQDYDERSLGEAIYALAAACGLDPKELFRVVYRALIGQEAGPRLANFLLTVGRERVTELLAGY